MITIFRLENERTSMSRFSRFRFYTAIFFNNFLEIHFRKIEKNLIFLLKLLLWSVRF
jgi:hypothetical protein